MWNIIAHIGVPANEDEMLDKTYHLDGHLIKQSWIARLDIKDCCNHTTNVRANILTMLSMPVIWPSPSTVVFNILRSLSGQLCNPLQPLQCHSDQQSSRWWWSLSQNSTNQDSCAERCNSIAWRQFSWDVVHRLMRGERTKPLCQIIWNLHKNCSEDINQLGRLHWSRLSENIFHCLGVLGDARVGEHPRGWKISVTCN